MRKKSDFGATKFSKKLNFGVGKGRVMGGEMVCMGGVGVVVKGGVTVLCNCKCVSD